MYNMMNIHDYYCETSERKEEENIVIEVPRYFTVCVRIATIFNDYHYSPNPV